MDVNEELKFLGKFTKKWGGGGRSGGGSGLWGGGGGGGQGGCERKIEVYGEIHKKKIGGGGVRVDAIEELKFLGKFKKKIFFLRGGGSGGGGRVGRCGGIGLGGGSGWM